MNDLISRKALLAKYDRVHIGEPGKARKLIEDAPRVDAVEVVRCKDCKCGKQTAWYSAKLRCTHPSHMNSQVPHEVPQEHFCSYGERKKQ